MSRSRLKTRLHPPDGNSTISRSKTRLYHNYPFGVGHSEEFGSAERRKVDEARTASQLRSEERYRLRSSKHDRFNWTKYRKDDASATRTGHHARYCSGLARVRDVTQRQFRPCG